MKFLIVAALLVATVSSKSVKITSLTNCGNFFHFPASNLFLLGCLSIVFIIIIIILCTGSPGAPISFSGTILTDPVPVPGQMMMDLTVSKINKNMFLQTNVPMSVCD